MKTIQELQDDLNHILRCAKETKDKAEKDNRKLTDAESKDIDNWLKQADDIKAEIKAQEDDIARGKRVDDAIGALNKAKPTKTTPDAPAVAPVEDSRPYAQPKSYRFGRLQAFKGPNAERNAYASGMWMRAVIGKSHKAIDWCNDNVSGFRDAMSEGVNSAGGVLVPDEMEQTIIDLREQYGVFRRESRMLPMASDTKDILRISGHLTPYFTGEAVAATASDMGTDTVKLVAKKLSTLTYVSDELEEDAIISIADLLANDAAYALALREDQCGFTGTGTSTYGGINGITNKIIGLAGAVDAVSGHDTFAEVDATDLANLRAKLPDYAANNAKFYCSRAAKALIFDRLKATAGGNSVQTLQGIVQDNYLGDPIVTSQVLPSSSSTINGTVMILYGDLRRSSTMGVRRGITIQRDPSVKFVEGQIALKVSQRFDILNHDLGDASTPGPLVALIGKS